MINYIKFRQDLVDTYLTIYNNGCDAALVEIARIQMASENELEDIAKSRGFDITKWQTEIDM